MAFTNQVFQFRSINHFDYGFGPVLVLLIFRKILMRLMAPVPLSVPTFIIPFLAAISHTALANVASLGQRD